MALSGLKDWRYKQAVRRNEVFFIRLTRAFQSLGKKTLATAAAASLEAAMEDDNTKHDSSRAAANWQLNVGNVNPYGVSPNEMHPKEYGRYGVGQRGDAGAQAAQVKSRKRQKYGYLKGGGGADVKVKERGWLWNAIGVGEKGTPGVHLFNPLLGAVKRRDGSGASYAENAFPGFVEADATKKAKIASTAVVVENIKELNAEIRRTKGRM
jgi:hypothetical protein